MRRLSALAVLLGTFATALAAEKLQPLDAEFLEYLASFEGDEEGWEWFADEEPAPPVEKPPAKREGSKTEAAANPAEKR